MSALEHGCGCHLGPRTPKMPIWLQHLNPSYAACPNGLSPNPFVVVAVHDGHEQVLAAFFLGKGTPTVGYKSAALVGGVKLAQPAAAGEVVLWNLWLAGLLSPRGRCRVGWLR